jgi:predicted ribosome quality control (RQC) complex YloA/Tae2 family protein
MHQRRYHLAFDGIITYHLIKELQSKLKGTKIRKIYQPENDEVHLVLAGPANATLLISANANQPRVHLTEKKKKNPPQPSTFCMVLRKHLINTTITDIRQVHSDRIIVIDILGRNDFGDPTTKSLIAEITGRNANLILTVEDDSNPQNGPVIIDALKRIGPSSSRYRHILPGLHYKLPPEKGRTDFFEVHDPSEFDHWLSQQPNQKIASVFVNGFLGISPDLAREFCFRAGIDSESSLADLTVKEKGYLSSSFFEIQNEIKNSCNPTLYYFHRHIQNFSTIPLHFLKDLEQRSVDSVSHMLESFYYLRDKRLRFNANSANLRHQLNTLYKKDTKKLDNLHRDFKKSQKAEKNKLYGDLITANIYRIQKGMDGVDLENFYDPDAPLLHIPLKVNQDPAQNAQRYYKKYNKAKRAQTQLTDQIHKTEETVYYLGTLLNALEQCTENEELDEIRYEVRHSDLVKHTKKSAKDKKPKASHPMHFLSSEGFDILVGKNNFQNDEISTKLGDPEDCWLHVKDSPGSHVLVIANGRFITEKTLLEAGQLAAYYSKARTSSNVPVDYVDYKYVHKPKNAKPGMVVFTNQNTMFVTPKQELVDQIKKISN